MLESVTRIRFLTQLECAFGEDWELAPVELRQRAERLGLLFVSRDEMIEVLQRTGVPLRGELFRRSDFYRACEAA